MKPILKLIIAIMLILCLADMPYGFYELVRFAAAGAFVYLSYDYFKNKKDGLGFLFAGLALLFQPFLLGRVLWNIIDIVVAVALIFLIVRAFKKEQ